MAELISVGNCPTCNHFPTQFIEDVRCKSLPSETRLDEQVNRLSVEIDRLNTELQRSVRVVWVVRWGSGYPAEIHGFYATKALAEEKATALGQMYKAEEWEVRR